MQNGKTSIGMTLYGVTDFQLLPRLRAAGDFIMYPSQPRPFAFFEACSQLPEPDESFSLLLGPLRNRSLQKISFGP